MGREQKKGKSGTAKAYISRGKAMKKLQLTLNEFRRLCILKGIYPRDPRKKLEGSDKTYYLTKDIDFLSHDPLIKQVRQKNAVTKKVIKARSNRRIDILKRLSLKNPKYNLNHLIIERYPNFNDVLNDLDDPLCIISLFANLPKHNVINLSSNKIAKCQLLLSQFMHFVTKKKSLSKSFVSIKGYYFQANINNVQINWITPHRFTQFIPKDVDFSVMKTFLDLYLTILHFVNFRLYTQNNLVYPPKIDKKIDAKGNHLDSLIVESAKSDPLQLEKADDSQNTKVTNDIVKEAEQIAKNAVTEGDEEDEEQDDDNNDNDDQNNAEDVDQSESEEEDNGNGEENVGEEKKDEEEQNETKVEDSEENAVEIDKQLKELNDDNEDNDDDNVGDEDDVGVFSGKSVILGREVPYIELEFVLRASGAKRVTREDDLPSTPSTTWSEIGYTHWIIDRPAVPGKRDMGLEFVQPQYVFDSVNAKILLPIELYTVGRHLPPHLSPFVTSHDDGGYRPWFEEVLERIKRGDESVVAEAAAVVYKEGEALKKKKEAGEENKPIEVESESQKESEKEENEEMDEGEEGDEDTDKENKDEEGEGEDKDSEGEEEQEEVQKKEATKKQEKDMAALMLSRRKRKQYSRVKGDELKREEKKQKLEKRRQQLEKGF